MFRNYRRCCSMNNNYEENHCEDVNDTMETKCNYVASYEENQDACNCGFDEEYNMFPANPAFGQSYVPFQYMDRTFKPCVGLKMGTIFPELVSPYVPGQSMEEIEYLRKMNQIGKGCNKCC